MANQQEYMMKMQMIQQEAAQLEEKLHTIDEQTLDLQSIKASIVDLEGKKKGDEILTNLGKGIFMKTKIEDKDLFVNVGKNTILKKDSKETVAIMDEQISKLITGKGEIMKRMEQLQMEMMQMIQEAQQAQQGAEEPAAKAKRVKKEE